jgi:hypothetical protein
MVGNPTTTTEPPMPRTPRALPCRRQDKRGDKRASEQPWPACFLAGEQSSAPPQTRVAGEGRTARRRERAEGDVRSGREQVEWRGAPSRNIAVVRKDWGQEKHNAVPLDQQWHNHQPSYLQSKGICATGALLCGT